MKLQWQVIRSMRILEFLAPSKFLVPYKSSDVLRCTERGVGRFFRIFKLIFRCC